MHVPSVYIDPGSFLGQKTEKINSLKLGLKNSNTGCDINLQWWSSENTYNDAGKGVSEF